MRFAGWRIRFLLAGLGFVITGAAYGVTIVTLAVVGLTSWSIQGVLILFALSLVPILFGIFLLSYLCEEMKDDREYQVECERLARELGLRNPE